VFTSLHVLSVLVMLQFGADYHVRVILSHDKMARKSLRT